VLGRVAPRDNYILCLEKAHGNAVFRAAMIVAISVVRTEGDVPLDCLISMSTNQIAIRNVMQKFGLHFVNFDALPLDRQANIDEIAVLLESHKLGAPVA
jgi:hypothetical protein